MNNKQTQALCHSAIDEMYHYGVLGMHWGVRRYQPYPSDYRGEGKYLGKQQKKLYKSLRRSNRTRAQARVSAMLDDTNDSRLDAVRNDMQNYTRKSYDRRLQNAKAAAEQILGEYKDAPADKVWHMEKIDDEWVHEKVRRPAAESLTYEILHETDRRVRKQRRDSIQQLGYDVVRKGHFFDTLSKDVDVNVPEYRLANKKIPVEIHVSNDDEPWLIPDADKLKDTEKRANEFAKVALDAWVDACCRKGGMFDSWNQNGVSPEFAKKHLVPINMVVHGNEVLVETHPDRTLAESLPLYGFATINPKTMKVKRVDYDS